MAQMPRVCGKGNLSIASCRRPWARKGQPFSYGRDILVCTHVYIHTYNVNIPIRWLYIYIYIYMKESFQKSEALDKDDPWQ